MVERDDGAEWEDRLLAPLARLPLLTWVAPTDVTYGHVPGKLGLNLPDEPFV